MIKLRPFERVAQLLNEGFRKRQPELMPWERKPPEHQQSWIDAVESLASALPEKIGAQLRHIEPFEKPIEPLPPQPSILEIPKEPT